MQLEDLTIEVRDRDLNRVGVILPTDATYTLRDEFCNVGAWELTIPLEHPMVPHLRKPGSGLIVTGSDGGTFLSGPTLSSSSVGSKDAPEGMVTFKGVTDDVVLADALAYPVPSIPTMAGQKASANDTRSGPLETLLHAYVNANIGPGAPAERRKARLTMGQNLGRGPSVVKSARFPVLGTLLNEIAALGTIGFRVIQRGSSLVFETYEVANRTSTVRMDLWNNTLASYDVQTAGATLTRAIVAGRNEGVDREFVERSTPEAIEQEALWGRRIERFLDRRSSDEVAELEQAGDEVLAKEGKSQAVVKFVPMDETTMRYIVDWFLGDRVTAVVEGQEMSAIVQAAIIKVDGNGIRLAVALGDAMGTTDELRAFKNAVEQRISAIERTVEVGAGHATPEGLPRGANLNDFVLAGTWGTTAEGLGSYVNLPLVAVGYVSVTVAADGRVWQEYRSAASPGPRQYVFTRMRSLAELWGPWRLESSTIAVASQADLQDVTSLIKGQANQPVQVMRTDAPNGFRVSADGVMWSRTVPDHAPYAYAPLGGGWRNYELDYHHAGYARSHAGIVFLTGLIVGGGPSSTTPILTLPAGFRPAMQELRLALGNDSAVRVDIRPDGGVFLMTHPSPGGWLSLDGISFPSADVAPNSAWTNVGAFHNGFGSYHALDPAWPPVSHWTDMYGRIWWRGLLRNTTTTGAPGGDVDAFTANTPPPGLPIQFPAIADNGFGYLDAFVVNGGQTRFRVKAGSLGMGFVSLDKAAYVPESRYPIASYDRFGAHHNGWSRYSWDFPAASMAVFPDGVAMMEGLVKGGAIGGGTRILRMPDGRAPDVAISGNGGRCGGVIYPTAALTQLARIEMTRTGPDVGTATAAQSFGQNGWSSLHGINYLIGS